MDPSPISTYTKMGGTKVENETDRDMIFFCLFSFLLLCATKLKDHFMYISYLYTPTQNTSVSYKASVISSAIHLPPTRVYTSGIQPET